MNMTKKRKSLQDKLRRKFKWSTNTNYNRGTILIKPNASTHILHHPKYVTDLAINIGDYQLRRDLLNGDGYGIEISMTKYDLCDSETYDKKETLYSYITPEELEIICKIIREKQMEVMN